MSRVVREWPSSRVGGPTYQMIEGEDGEIYCTCPAWRFSKEEPKCCKHMKAWAEKVARDGAKLLGPGLKKAGAR